MERHDQGIPPYTVKRHPRARHVRLKLSVRGELEVVVPQRYDARKIPAIILEKRGWLDSALQHLERQRRELPQDHFDIRPATLKLRSIEEEYTVIYRHWASDKLNLHAADSVLRVSGPVGNLDLCQDALQRWLRRKARATLVPWLQRTSQELGLPFNNTVIRGQKTLWASCTASKIINLNFKLIFLPPQLTHYVMVHELCHTRHMNHSSRYWSLVGRKLPSYEELEEQINGAWKYVPGWAGE